MFGKNYFLLVSAWVAYLLMTAFCWMGGISLSVRIAVVIPCAAWFWLFFIANGKQLGERAARFFFRLFS